MNVLEQKAPLLYKDDLKKIIKLLTYKTNKLELKGSASLASQQFFSDYDLFCVIEKPDQKDFVAFLQGLLKKIDDADDLWFIELKLQTNERRSPFKTGKKIRVFPQQPLKESDVERVWDKLDIVKVDLIARIENYFVEVSVIYSFTPETPTKEEYIKSLEGDIKDLRKEGKYYKILKRQFNIYKTQGQKKELLQLSKIFNGELGRDYQLVSNLEAMEKVLEYHQEPSLFKKIIVNLKDIKLSLTLNGVGDVKSVEGLLKEKSKVLNESAKKLL